MSQDVVADALSQIRNANRARKKTVVVKRFSSVLIGVLEIMRSKKYIEGFDILKDKTSLKITIGRLNDCKAIKPRFNVKNEGIDKYVRRFLPARNFGVIIISTNQGLLTHEESIEKNIGGSLVAYFY
jgi:small subunit ribosomal protein S8